MKVGDLVVAMYGDYNLYRGFGIITEVDAKRSKTAKVYWLETGEHKWEQFYHLEAYCKHIREEEL